MKLTNQINCGSSLEITRRLREQEAALEAPTRDGLVPSILYSCPATSLLTDRNGNTLTHGLALENPVC